MPGLGHRGYLGIAQETAWANGTPGVLGWQFINIQTEAIKHSKAFVFVGGIRGARDNERRKESLAEAAAGPHSWFPDVEDGLGMLLKNILPTEVTTDNGAGNGGLHVFSPGDPAGASLTYLVARDTTPSGTNIWQAFGGVVKKLSFEAQEGALLKGDVDLEFQKMTPGAGAQTPSYTTQNPLVYHRGTLAISTAAVAIKGFKIDIDPTLLGNRGKLLTPYPQQPQPGVYRVTGELDAYFDSMDQVNAFLNGTDVSLALQFSGSALGTSTRLLKFEIPTLQFTGEPPTISGEGEIMLKLPFHAYRSGLGNPDKLIQVSLLNSKRTAY